MRPSGFARDRELWLGRESGTATALKIKSAAAEDADDAGRSRAGARGNAERSENPPIAPGASAAPDRHEPGRFPLLHPRDAT